MDRVSVEALWFRFAAAYPSAAAPQPGTLEEWLSTPEIAAMDPTLAHHAFDDWKRDNEWPPTISRFIAQARRTSWRLECDARAALPPAEEPDPWADPDEHARQLAQVREWAEGRRILRGPPGDDQPQHRDRRTGSLVYRRPR